MGFALRPSSRPSPSGAMGAVHAATLLLACGSCPPTAVLAHDEQQVTGDGAKLVEDGLLGSYVGAAACDMLNGYGADYATHHPDQWDLTRGRVVGGLDYTPPDFWDPAEDATANDPPEGHSDRFAIKVGEIVSRTTQFCDVMSLSPPDGMFLSELNGALRVLADRAEEGAGTPIAVRFMFGHIIAEPVNVTGVLHDLTEGILVDADSAPNLRVWVGAWREGLSWNHAKIVAVDGRYLETGGHNMWDSDYLRGNPVHDLSFGLEGPVTDGAHRFADWQWKYLRDHLGRTPVGSAFDLFPPIWREHEGLGNIVEDFSSKLSGSIPPLALASVAEFPPGRADDFPPQYDEVVGEHINTEQLASEGGGDREGEMMVPLIGMGKQGTVMDDEPSEDAFVSMFDSARYVIKFAQQDVGPRAVCPGLPIPFPGFSWPEHHLSAMGRALYRGVDIEMVLSNLEAREMGGYSNGWPCNVVAAKIIETIPMQFPDEFSGDASEDKARLREIVRDRLRIGFLRGAFGNTWEDGSDMALHSKHFIIDDICSYIGSENIYAFDLAEWGVVVDDANETQRMMRQIWDPMYEHSYTGQDCDLDEVIDDLYADADTDRNVTGEMGLGLGAVVDCLQNEYGASVPEFLLDFLSVERPTTPTPPPNGGGNDAAATTSGSGGGGGEGVETFGDETTPPRPVGDGGSVQEGDTPPSEGPSLEPPTADAKPSAAAGLRLRNRGAFFFLGGRIFALSLLLLHLAIFSLFLG